MILAAKVPYREQYWYSFDNNNLYVSLQEKHLNQQSPTENTNHLGKGMIFAAWILVLGLLTLFFHKWWQNEYNPNQEYLSKTTSEGVREVQLKRNRFGHYLANGKINGQEVIFLLDTGATSVSIPQEIARKLNLKPGLAYSVQTANGVISVYATKLETLELGDIMLQNIRAHINPKMDGSEILLGMVVLKKLELMQKGDTLTLRQYP